jgi:hypothetical protein
MIELQTSVKTSEQDDTTRTHTPQPGYLKLTIITTYTLAQTVLFDPTMLQVYRYIHWEPTFMLISF